MAGGEGGGRCFRTLSRGDGFGGANARRIATKHPRIQSSKLFRPELVLTLPTPPAYSQSSRRGERAFGSGPMRAAGAIERGPSEVREHGRRGLIRGRGT